MACKTCKDISTIIKGAKGFTKVGMQKIGIGIDQANPQQIKDRRDKCRDCDHAIKNPDPKFAKNNGLTSLSICSKCSCNIAAKTKISSEVCPIARW